MWQGTAKSLEFLNISRAEFINIGEIEAKGGDSASDGVLVDSKKTFAN